MGKYNMAALRVREATERAHTAGKKGSLPCWTNVIRDYPPSEVLVRKRPEQHQLIRQRMAWGNKPVFEVVEQGAKSKKASKMYLPVAMKYEEDQLRKEFFRDHPWELARPRILVESTGKDAERYDWSKLRQPGKMLDGESVVQRQLWLLNNVPNMTKNDSYDIARREFYRLRLQEDIERRVAAEEAEATGANFGPTYHEIGMELESKEYENWKKWAKMEANIVDQGSTPSADAPLA